MGLFDALGEIIKLPGSVVKDVLQVDNKEGSSSDTNTGQRLDNLTDDFLDIFK